MPHKLVLCRWGFSPQLQKNTMQSDCQPVGQWVPLLRPTPTTDRAAWQRCRWATVPAVSSTSTGATWTLPPTRWSSPRAGTSLWSTTRLEPSPPSPPPGDTLTPLSSSSTSGAIKSNTELPPTQILTSNSLIKREHFCQNSSRLTLAKSFLFTTVHLI